MEGYLSTEELKNRKLLPSEERLRKGRIAVIECIQDIPCNPCAIACKVGAIDKPQISTPPTVDMEMCTGCRRCVGVCPGLAIFVLHIKGDKGYVSLPYEMSPIPKVGQEVILLDRAGVEVGKGKVTEAYKPIKDDTTYLVTVETPKPEMVYEVRAIRVKWN